MSEKKPFEPKTKAGKACLDALKKVDEFITSKTDDPGEKEVVNIMINRLETIVGATKTKIDDAIFKAFALYFRNKYKV